MDKLNVGIVGCGNISAAYLRLAPLFPALQVTAVADIDPDAAAERAEEYGVKALSVEDMMASDVDAVVNLTIPEAHVPVSKQALEAGKHVYSEKPFALSTAEGEELRSLAEAKGLRVGSAPDTWMGGAHQLARARIDEGLIGDVVAGSCHVMSHGMEHWHPNPDFFFLPGAGPIFDLGPYYITNLVQLIGPVKRVASLTTSATPTRTIRTEGPRQGEEIPVRTPTNIHALLEFENGATITFSASWDVWAHRHGNMELYGLEGSLFVPDPNFFGGQVDHAGRDGQIAPLAAWDHPFGRPNQEHPKLGPLANYRTAGLADMAQAIVDGRPHRCALELALHVVDVMDAILKAGETGTWVTLSTTCARPAALSPADAATLMED
ncbi:Gfo/Idh/MocA family oxidoreductase [Psychromarinibacter sp. C21-152]|uniref:Gfo/Idh/MocA family oxidoreductase n=1 Tax=Psychromarinibacter sediminicola TaxID=3033385 RepID=A0AAE3T8Q4_9RHOB|nr:Gfo/Idh/MocA family oxidoreductase [Psychromarinibacter sediminicola]MDF0601670.1 Gfo/Idh/MocA family oxidoreductase [Psychromarinibacter sediminicola]